MEVRSLSRALAALTVAAALAAPAYAQAQDFGINTVGNTPNVPFTCSSGVPTLRIGVAVGAPPFAIGSSGFPTCTWTSAGFNAGFYPPGPGTVTAVQLPPLQNPGPMQVVVLQSERINGASPGLPTLVCCQFVRASQAFTPAPNTPSNIPMNLPVQVGAVTANPGESASGQFLALSILSPTAQLPVLDLGSDEAPISSLEWLPAYNGSTQEFISGNTAAGYVLLMSASFTPAGATGGGGTGGGGTGGGGTGGGGTGGGGAPGGGTGGGGTGGGGTGMTNPTIGPPSASALGLTLRGSTSANRRGVIGLGSAANPPAAATTQKLTSGKTTVASGKTTIASGRTAKLTVKLSKKGKALLRKKKTLKTKLTMTVTDGSGVKQSYTRTITLKR